MQIADVYNGPSVDEHLERSNMWMLSCVSVCGHNYIKHVDVELCVCLSVDTTTINMWMVSCISVCGHNYNKHVDGELCFCLWTQLQ